MATYRIPFLNSSADMIDPVLRWTFAGFHRNDKGEIVTIAMTVELKTDTFKGEVEFLQPGTVDDRSDAAIDALMILLMDQYKI